MTVNELLNHLIQALQKKQIDGQANIVIETRTDILRTLETVRISQSTPNEVILEY